MRTRNWPPPKVFKRAAGFIPGAADSAGNGLMLIATNLLDLPAWIIGLMLIATNLLDLPAWIIGLIYRYRWTI